MIKKAALLKENLKLKRKIYILENIGISINASTVEKEQATKKFLENNPDYTMYEVCSAIRLPKGTYYNFIHYKVDKPWFVIKEEKLTESIINVFKESKCLYGQERIKSALKSQGIDCALLTISKIMKKNNLVPISKNKRKKVFKYLTKEEKELNLVNRKFNQPRPNMVWVSDFIEIKGKCRKYYLCTIMDLFSRKIISHKIEEKQTDDMVIQCIDEAYKSRIVGNGLIFHSDRGTQFKTNKVLKFLTSKNIKQSFSCPGRPNDNACIESFYSTLRREEINVHSDAYVTKKEIEKYIKEYITFYNEKRIHSSNNGLPPSVKEQKFYANVH